jgi:hypothetical protein
MLKYCCLVTTLKDECLFLLKGIFVIMFRVINVFLGRDFLVAVSEMKYVFQALSLFEFANIIPSVTVNLQQNKTV